MQTPSCCTAGDGEEYDEDGYDRDGYDEHGYDRDGYDEEGYDADSYNRYGAPRHQYDRHGYDAEGYDVYGYDAEGYNEDGYDQEGNHRDESEEGGSEEQDGTPGSDEPPGSYDEAPPGPSQPQPIPHQHAAPHPGHVDPASLAALQHIRQYGTPVAPVRYSAPQAPLQGGSQAAPHSASHPGPQSVAAALQQQPGSHSLNLLSTAQHALAQLMERGARPPASVKAEPASAVEPAAEARSQAHAEQALSPTTASINRLQQLMSAKTQARRQLELSQALGAGMESMLRAVLHLVMGGPHVRGIHALGSMLLNSGPAWAQPEGWCKPSMLASVHSGLRLF